MNSALEQSSIQTFNVDAEHAPLRLTVLGAFVAAWVVAFIILSALIPSQGGLNLLAVLISFGVSYVVSTVLERVLKGRWHSGRVVVLNTESVRLLNKGTVQEEMRIDEAVNVLMWRFQINKRARVPKGWWMLACGLQRDDHYLTVYTFMSPSSFDQLENGNSFTRLAGKKERANQQQSLRDDLRLAGEQRRLVEAESHRWMDGAEMTNDDFKAFVAQLKPQYPEWSFNN